MTRVRPGSRLVFFGDSITHCDRETTLPPLGWGYVRLFASFFEARYPEHGITVVNRGVGGDTVLDLEARLERDVLAERPDWLFVMIGINDVCYRPSPDFAARAVDDETYAAAYRRLIRRAQAAAACRITLLEPTVPEWNEPFAHNPAVERLCGVIRDVAAETGVEVVPIFDRFRRGLRAARGREHEWMLDVPHPFLKGHALVAAALLEHVAW
jgi:lysophospholipase L1-like esterase